MNASHVRGKVCLNRGLFAVRTSSFSETAHLELAEWPPFFKAHPMLWTPPHPSGPAVAVTPAMPHNSGAVLLHHRHSETGLEGGRGGWGLPRRGGGGDPGLLVCPAAPLGFEGFLVCSLLLARSQAAHSLNRLHKAPANMYVCQVMSHTCIDFHCTVTFNGTCDQRHCGLSSFQS